MRHAARVAVVDAGKQLAHELSAGGLAHGAPVDDLVEELAAAGNLHEDEVEVRLSGALPARTVAEKRDDVVMHEPFKDGALFADRLQAHLPRVNHLDRRSLP
eukprot:scaffold57945_cov48-Phaeocystis_antarctica.AAC.4